MARIAPAATGAVGDQVLVLACGALIAPDRVMYFSAELVPWYRLSAR